MVADYQSIISHFRGWDLNDEARSYLRFHARRYAFLLNTLRVCLDSCRSDTRLADDRILDVGPSFLTQLMRDGNLAGTIDSLGFQDRRFRCRESDRHIEYDLTEAGDAASRPRLPPYDIIVMAEVIEHLPVAPGPVFELLSGMLKPRGFLIVQTPNACSLPKRLRMLVGRNPFEMIRDRRQSAGHFREYTMRELADLVRTAGLSVSSTTAENYFLRETRSSRLFRLLGPLFPPSLRDGITVCARKEYNL